MSAQLLLMIDLIIALIIWMIDWLPLVIDDLLIAVVIDDWLIAAVIDDSRSDWWLIVLCSEGNKAAQEQGLCHPAVVAGSRQRVSHH